MTTSDRPHDLTIESTPDFDAQFPSSAFSSPMTLRLRPHQLTAVKLLLSRFAKYTESEQNDNVNDTPSLIGAILADQRGLGKTLTSLAFAQILVGVMKCVVIVVCTSVGVSHWYEESLRWLPAEVPRPTVIGIGNDASVIVGEFVKASNTDNKMIILSYKSFRKYSKQLDSFCVTIGCKALLVLDEVEKRCIDGGDHIDDVLRMSKASMRLAVSAEVVGRDMLELYNVASLVQPEVLGARKTFEQRIMLPLLQGSDLTASKAAKSKGLTALNELNRMLHGLMIRRTQDEVLQYLPPVHGALTAEQRVEYCRAAQTMRRFDFPSMLNQVRSPAAAHGLTQSSSASVAMKSISSRSMHKAGRRKGLSKQKTVRGADHSEAAPRTIAGTESGYLSEVEPITVQYQQYMQRLQQLEGLHSASVERLEPLKSQQQPSRQNVRELAGQQCSEKVERYLQKLQMLLAEDSAESANEQNDAAADMHAPLALADPPASALPTESGGAWMWGSIHNATDNYHDDVSDDDNDDDELRTGQQQSSNIDFNRLRVTNDANVAPSQQPQSVINAYGQQSSVQVESQVGATMFWGSTQSADAHDDDGDCCDSTSETDARGKNSSADDILPHTVGVSDGNPFSRMKQTYQNSYDAMSATMSYIELDFVNTPLLHDPEFLSELQRKTDAAQAMLTFSENDVPQLVSELHLRFQDDCNRRRTVAAINLSEAAQESARLEKFYREKFALAENSHRAHVASQAVAFISATKRKLDSSIQMDQIRAEAEFELAAQGEIVRELEATEANLLVKLKQEEYVFHETRKFWETKHGLTTRRFQIAINRANAVAQRAQTTLDIAALQQSRILSEDATDQKGRHWRADAEEALPVGMRSAVADDHVYSD